MYMYIYIYIYIYIYTYIYIWGCSGIQNGRGSGIFRNNGVTQNREVVFEIVHIT